MRACVGCRNTCKSHPVTSDGAPSGQVPNANPDSELVRAHADLPTWLVLYPNVTYWIGISGNDPKSDATNELGMSFMLNGKGPLLDNGIARYSDTKFNEIIYFGDGQFRLWGNRATFVPEPPTWALLVSLLFLLGRSSDGGRGGTCEFQLILSRRATARR